MWLFKSNKLESLSILVDFQDAKRLAKILVIDDDPNAFPLEQMTNEGYHVEYWEKVRSISPLEQNEFDIIILDIAGVAKEFSEDDGLGILETIKANNPSQLVIAFSGESFNLGKNRFWEMADGVLCKPVDTVTCKREIDALLKARFTLQYCWNNITFLLRKEGLGDKAIDAIKGKLARAIRKKNVSLFEKVLNKAVSSAQVLSAIMRVADQIYAIAKVG